MTEEEFYIIDIRKEWQKQKYITFWRPNNSDYAWPLCWAGRYSKAEVDADGSYYCNTGGSKELLRFPVPCNLIEAIAIAAPDPGDIDGNRGPVLRNSKRVRDQLRAMAYIPPGVSAPQPSDTKEQLNGN